MREENPTLPKSCKQGVQIKRPNFLPSVSPSLSILWHPIKIGIWLSSNPSRIIIRLGNIGNQGMRHSPYLQTPHISLRSREKRVKNSDPMWGSYTLSDSRVPLGNLNLFWKKNLAKLWARNLNEQQKTFRWRLFSPSTSQGQWVKTNTPHPPAP